MPGSSSSSFSPPTLSWIIFYIENTFRHNPSKICIIHGCPPIRITKPIYSPHPNPPSPMCPVLSTLIVKSPTRRTNGELTTFSTLPKQVYPSSSTWTPKSAPPLPNSGPNIPTSCCATSITHHRGPSRYAPNTSTLFLAIATKSRIHSSSFA